MWESYSDEQLSDLESLAAKYKKCLDFAKTERESVELAVKYAKEHGYRDINEYIRQNRSLSAGDKVYAECMGKTLVLFHMKRVCF